MASNQAAQQRFLREARMMAAIEHENIVTIHQVGEHAGMPFLAMPFLRGETLESSLRRDPQPPIGDVLRIGREVAEGLAAAHAQGLIHRDIKPANIWLEQGQTASASAAAGFRRVYDMHGNAGEWCLDSFDRDFYRKSPKQDPLCWVPAGIGVFRGGTWINPPINSRSAKRDADGADRSNLVGFRIVLVPSKPPSPAAVSLFNGRDLNRWKLHDGTALDKGPWSVVGSLGYDPSTPEVFQPGAGTGILLGQANLGNRHLVSAYEHGDCSFHCEFAVARAGDTGIYFQVSTPDP
jgi:serine/threonine protein kinase